MPASSDDDDERQRQAKAGRERTNKRRHEKFIERIRERLAQRDLRSHRPGEQGEPIDDPAPANDPAFPPEVP